MKSKKVFYTIMASAIAMVIYCLINLFLTPYITETVGVEAYGFVSLSKTFVVYACVITVALSSYSTRFIAVSYHRNDITNQNRYYSSVVFGNLVLSIIMVILFVIIAVFAEKFFVVPTELVIQVKILFTITGVSFGITTFFSAYSSSAYLENQLIKVNILKCISYISEAIVLILLFSVFSSNIWFVAVGTLISAIIVGVTDFVICKKYTPSLNFSFELVSKSCIKNLIGNGIWNSLNSLGSILNSGLDLLVTNWLLAPLAMGQLAIAKQISTLFGSLFMLASQPFQPSLLKEYSDNNSEGMLNTLKNAIMVSGFFSNLAFAAFVSLGELFYDLWIPGQDTHFVWELTVITVFASIIEGAVYPLYYVYMLNIKNKIPCLITIAGGVVNVVSMYVLIKFTSLGVYAVVLTTAIIMTAINLIFDPLYMAHCLNIKNSYFYKPLVRHLISCFFMTLVFLGINFIPLHASWVSLILKGIIGCAICIPIHIWAHGEKIKDTIKSNFPNR